MGAMPIWHRPLLLARRPMGAIFWREEMPRTLVLLARKRVPMAMAPRLPLAYLLCNNQPYFQSSDREMRELGSHRQRLPWYTTRRAFQPRLMGDWGCLRRRTVPRQLGMHWSQGTPLHLRAACRPQSLMLQRGPWLAQGGRLQADPRPLYLQQRPGTLMHDRAACRPWPLVWEWATWLVQ